MNKIFICFFPQSATITDLVNLVFIWYITLMDKANNKQYNVQWIDQKYLFWMDYKECFLNVKSMFNVSFHHRYVSEMITQGRQWYS